jgi:hypothetical protein
VEELSEASSAEALLAALDAEAQEEERDEVME